MPLSIRDSSIMMLRYPIPFSLAKFELSPRGVNWIELNLNNSMLWIFMPFSNYIPPAIRQYSDSFSLAICIKVPSVYAIQIGFLFNVCKSIFDGLEFRLEQPVKLFGIGDIKNGIREHFQAVVYLHYIRAISLNDLLEKLMSNLRCLIIFCKENHSIYYIVGHPQHIPKLNIIFLEQISHYSWALMEVLAKFLVVTDRKGKDFYNEIFVIYLSKLVDRSRNQYFFHI